VNLFTYASWIAAACIGACTVGTATQIVPPGIGLVGAILPMVWLGFTAYVLAQPTSRDRLAKDLANQIVDTMDHLSIEHGKIRVCVEMEVAKPK